MDISIFLSIILAAGIPSTIVSFLVWRLQRNIDRREKKRDAIEKEQRIYDAAILSAVRTSCSLGHQVARYVINNGCNGNTEEYLRSSEVATQKLDDVVRDRAVRE